MAAAYPFRGLPSPERHCNRVKIGVQSRPTVMVSTSNILTIRPPRSPESRPQSGQESQSLNGSLSVVSTLDLIEWLCSNRKIWSLRLHGQGQGQTMKRQSPARSWWLTARWSMRGGAMSTGCRPSARLSVARRDLSIWCLSPAPSNGRWMAIGKACSSARCRCSTSAITGPAVKRSLKHRRNVSGPLRRRRQLMLIALSPDGQVPADAQAAPSVADGVLDARKDASASAVALIDRGFAALRAGNPAEARQCWTQALASIPTIAACSSTCASSIRRRRG